MKDALELSSAIINGLKSELSLDSVVRTFEEAMFPRMNKVQRETMRNKTGMFFKDDAPIGLMLSFIETVAEDSGYDLTKRVWFSIFITLKAMCFSYFWTISTFGKLRRRLRDAWSR
jgi:hypothetical protein